MKKLLLLVFLQVFSFSKTTAQKNALSFVIGPSAFRYAPDQILKSDLKPSMGFVTGLDFTHSIRAGLSLKLGIRYNAWQLPNLEGPLTWPSEHDGNGGYQFDSSLQHYTNKGYESRSAWQYLTGLGWEGRQKAFRWFTYAELGLTSFVKNNAGPSISPHPFAGLSFGSGWALNPKLCVFVSPSGRLTFRGSSKQFADKFNTFSMQIELGARYSFSKL